MGSDFSEIDKALCRKIFRTAAGKNIESYDLFVEKALTMLAHNGIMAFVLPESILSVAAHEAARKLLFENCSFRFVSYLGNVFSGVQCPSIILGVAFDDSKTIVGCKVSIGNRSFIISQDRTFSQDAFSFNVSDEENKCLSSISEIKNAAFLREMLYLLSESLQVTTGNTYPHLNMSAMSLF